MTSKVHDEHWLDHYGSDEYLWKSFQEDNRTTFYRPLGLVEGSFDADGRYFEGRADFIFQLDLQVKCRLSKVDFREHVLLAWTCLRCKYLLHQARALSTKKFYGRDLVAESNMCFAVRPPRTTDQAIEDAREHLVFIDDHYDHVDPADFWTHCQNTGRIVDPEEALSRMFVYGLELDEKNRGVLRFLSVAAHEIQDALSANEWKADFILWLNQTPEELLKRLAEFLDPGALCVRLPLPQEVYYPPVSGNLARRRWFWLLTRILRHVRRPLGPAFANPLRRRHPQTNINAVSPKYTSLLDYRKRPPNSCFTLFARASLKGSQRLYRLCQEANTSVGAGSFALAALIMQEMYEEREPDIPLHERRPFISGFPLNPRPFFNRRVETDSLMLAFCDGISLPFLPSDLDFDGRLRLLSKQAHRQLAAYQKRKNRNQSDADYMSSRGAGRMLATQYLNSLERRGLNLPDELRRNLSPQGSYAMRPNASLQTCGVSSVGRPGNAAEQGTFDLDNDSKDFVVDYKTFFAAARPRDNEFLVGVGSHVDGLWASGSIDGNYIDPILVEKWRLRFESILDEDNGMRSSKL